MSGTAFGTVVLHVRLKRRSAARWLRSNGDRIRLSVAAKTIDLLISKEELGKRLANHVPPPTPARGYAALYQKSVTQAPSGCDFDFLAGK